MYGVMSSLGTVSFVSLLYVSLADGCLDYAVMLMTFLAESFFSWLFLI